MIPAFCAIWMMARHGKEAAIVFALAWGCLDMIDASIKRYSGHGIVEYFLMMLGLPI